MKIIEITNFLGHVYQLQRWNRGLEAKDTNKIRGQRQEWPRPRKRRASLAKKLPICEFSGVLQKRKDLRAENRKFSVRFQT